MVHIVLIIPNIYQVFTLCHIVLSAIYVSTHLILTKKSCALDTIFSPIFTDEEMEE